jgi:hypothetical protein
LSGWNRCNQSGFWGSSGFWRCGGWNGWWHQSGTGGGTSSSTDSSIESVPSRQGHVQSVIGQEHNDFSDENGIDVASFSGASVSISGGTCSLVVGGHVKWIGDADNNVSVLGIHITWSSSIGVEIDVQAVVVLVPCFASGIDDILSWPFVWSVLTESAPASVVGDGRDGEQFNDFPVVFVDVVGSAELLPDVSEVRPFIGHYGTEEEDRSADKLHDVFFTGLVVVLF